jgi:hypothetical protein
MSLWVWNAFQISRMPAGKTNTDCAIILRLRNYQTVSGPKLCNFNNASQVRLALNFKSQTVTAWFGLMWVLLN